MVCFPWDFSFQLRKLGCSLEPQALIGISRFTVGQRSEGFGPQPLMPGEKKSAANDH
jgi:hypothetical protein